MKATPTVIRQPEAAGHPPGAEACSLIASEAGNPGGTVGVTAHALAVRARPWIPRPPAPARTDT